MIITHTEYVRRHLYCVDMSVVNRTLRDTLKRHPDFQIKPHHRRPVCDHPEDGLCLGAAGDDITDAQLAEVNARHQPKQPPKAEKVQEGPKRPLPEGLRRWMEQRAKEKL